jgi:hypothetical protein
MGLKSPSITETQAHRNGIRGDDMTDEFTLEEIESLRRARKLLEYPGLGARITNVIGMPIDRGFNLLPDHWQQKVGEATRAALLKGLEFSVVTLDSNSRRKSQDWMHKLLVSTSGAVGGAFGFAALPLELPVSTCIILRSIADIAQSEQQDISQITVRLSCLEVLALGGKTSKDDSVKSGYWGVRIALAKAISEAAAYIAEKGLAEESAPAILRLISAIGTRFGVIVSEELAAKAIPVAGAVLGAGINYMFMDHFQDMAHGHFTVLRLENKYGMDAVRCRYEALNE